MIDCHLHLQAESLQNDVSEIMASAQLAGIRGMVVNGTHPGDWGTVEDLAIRFPCVIPSFGLHPWRVKDVDWGWADTLEAMLQRHPTAGVGEVGLDKWIRGGDFTLQREVFERQLEIATRLRRPLSIHCLKAWGSLRDSLRQHEFTSGWLLHSFGGPAEMVGELVDQGAFFSISGYFFRPEKREKLSLFERIPEHRILLETDAPEMIPPPEMVRFPLRAGGTGEAVNHPANLVAIYESYASWCGIPFEEGIGRIRENFKTWFFGGGMIP